ncbi:MAG TPA: alpha/beta hydrolase [Clostridia bacterium]|nr:alpha/beta hydrolase [Clostridia bacterium]
MGFEIILAVVIIFIIIFSVLSYIAGLFMFNVTMLPKSPKNIFRKKDKDMTEQMKAFHESSKKWVDENTASIWSLTTYDNLLLKARYIKGENTDKWVILVHGYTAVGWHMAEFAKAYKKMGYNILIPDLRGHGESQGLYVTMGYYDSVDIIEWIYEIIKDNIKAKIVLHGISMGAATVMLVTGEDLTEHVKCVIEDCGYTCVWEIFRYNMRRMFKLPAFPILYAANIISSAKIKMDFKEVSPIKAVKKSNTPTLFIHGDADELVPFYMLDKLYESAACEKEKLVIKGAAHGESSMKEPDTYYEKVSGFIAKYLN